MSDIEGFILAGGASSRMGTDKAQLRLDGSTFVERISEALARVAVRVHVVTASEDGRFPEFPRVLDVYKNCGALGGIHAALAHCKTDWAAVVSCDLPFVTGELFARLAASREDGREAVAPVQADGRPQPLCALYERASCLKAAETLLGAGERRAQALLSRVNTRRLGSEELSDLDGAAFFFTNVNTPDDYARAREQLPAFEARRS